LYFVEKANIIEYSQAEAVDRFQQVLINIYTQLFAFDYQSIICHMAEIGK